MTSNPSSITANTSGGRLENFPVMFFAVPMGLLGTTIAIGAAETAHGLGNAFSNPVLVISMLVFALVVLSYALKLVIHPKAASQEWNHPIRIAFFPAASISILLVSIALFEDKPDIARWLWITGAVLQGVLALAVIGAWIGHRHFQQTHLTPAWFIPAVGNVIVPIVGARLGYEDVSWLFFAGGLIFWVILLTLVMNRLMFHDALPGKMVPTLMILVAPPSVAFVSWLRLTGEVDAFGHVLISLGYVFAALVLTQADKFRTVPFALSWWALSFPLAALSIASFAYAGSESSAAHLMIGTGLLVVLMLAVVGLLLRTGLAMVRREICIME